ncbi:hypothetical protein PROFUN_12622 [Planoprotostelium fungivorum]|uniref:ubiquitinyl hydrolase 1 n=1 Tax=Planoprotostelium fungivorum TaxID=1890364 RepID=A0A2P6N739_9EUKA|nr:hypothetical protein PROFUN_12622 [Planoprotostelium fungivorum]
MEEINDDGKRGTQQRQFKSTTLDLCQAFLPLFGIINLLPGVLPDHLHFPYRHTSGYMFAILLIWFLISLGALVKNPYILSQRWAATRVALPAVIISIVGLVTMLYLTFNYYTHEEHAYLFGLGLINLGLTLVLYLYSRIITEHGISHGLRWGYNTLLYTWGPGLVAVVVMAYIEKQWWLMATFLPMITLFTSMASFRYGLLMMNITLFSSSYYSEGKHNIRTRITGPGSKRQKIDLTMVALPYHSNPANTHKDETIDEEKVQSLMHITEVARERAVSLLKTTRGDLNAAVERVFNPSGEEAAAGTLATLATSKEDQELQKAIELSKQQTREKPVEMVDLSKPEDTNMAIAVENSLMANADGMSTINHYENPQFRKREDNVPVGIKNIGQTCYVNSLLQAYFHIPKLKRAILSYPTKVEPSDINPVEDEPSKKEDTDKMDLEVKEPPLLSQQSVQFMHELQKLFAMMELSNQKYVDPTALLGKVIGRDGKPVQIGDQGDVADFCEIFETNIARGFKAIAKNGEVNLVDELFHGTGVQYSSAKEQDSTTTESTKDAQISTLILPIGEESSNVYERIDEALTDESDYVTDKGYQSVANRSLWFKKLPDVVFLLQSRVYYDKESKTYLKRETPIHFPKELFMDRFYVENQAITTQKRRESVELKAHLAQQKQNLLNYTRYKGRDHAIDSAIESTLDYLKDNESDPSIIQLMDGYLQRERNNIQEIRDKIKGLEDEIEGLYSQLNQREKYQLFAACIHQGVAGSGHYWTHIRDLENNKWIKYNDVRVNEEEEENVMKDGLGQSRNATSAYFLIYVRDRQGDPDFSETFRRETVEGMQKSLREEVEESNKKFSKELEEWEKKAMNSGDKIQQIQYRFTSRLVEEEKAVEASGSLNEPDLRMKDLSTFLAAFAGPVKHGGYVASTIYKEIMNRSIVEDMGFSSHERMQQVLGDDVTKSAVDVVLNDTDIKKYEGLMNRWRWMYLYWYQAMESFTKEAVIEACKNVLGAYKAVREIEEMDGKYVEGIIYTAVKIVKKTNILTMLGNVDTDTIAESVRHLVLLTTIVVPRSSPDFAEISEPLLVSVGEMEEYLGKQEEMIEARQLLLQDDSSPLPPSVPLPKEPEDWTKFAQLFASAWKTFGPQISLVEFPATELMWWLADLVHFPSDLIHVSARSGASHSHHFHPYHKMGGAFFLFLFCVTLSQATKSSQCHPRHRLFLSRLYNQLTLHLAHSSTRYVTVALEPQAPNIRSIITTNATRERNGIFYRRQSTSADVEKWQ